MDKRVVASLVIASTASFAVVLTHGVAARPAASESDKAQVTSVHVPCIFDIDGRHPTAGEIADAAARIAATEAAITAMFA
ncbi:hypothetical protein [Mycobacterium sp. GA-2829]|uniref:hypothetical protein n=1 Tax=Mycobacterium sp. GA-2829 TaxID=1772283 RepID=UPI00073FC190|nr:hypothetical protein [Mycobacterium sp. GA-2829]KUI33463.1 hypothetical protein AU194_29455 [Mycobacterium sp. GA-2829]